MVDYADPDIWYDWVQNASLLLVYFFVRNASEKIVDHKIIDYWWYSAILVSLIAVKEVAYAYNIKADSTLGNPNILSSFLVMCFPVFVYKIFEPKIINKVIATIALGLWAMALYATHSWSGVIGSVVTLFLFFYFWIDNFSKRVFLYISTIIIIFIIWINFPVLELSLVKQISSDVRLYLWDGTLAMIEQNPFFGVGPGHWYVQFPYFRDIQIFILDKAVSASRHAHNAWLQETAESGIFAGMLWILLPFLAWGSRFKYYHEKIDHFDKVLGIAMAGLLFTNMFDVNLEFQTSQFFFAVILGWLGRAAKPITHLKNPRWFLGALLALAIICSMGMSCHLLGQYWYRQAIIARHDENWDKAIQNYQKSIKFFPEMDVMYKLAYAFAQKKDLDSAMAAYFKVKDRAPLFADVNANLGSLYAQKKQYGQAQKFFQIELALNPYHIQALQGLFMVYLAEHKWQSAERLLRKIQVFYPDHPIAKKRFSDFLPST